MVDTKRGSFELNAVLDQLRPLRNSKVRAAVPFLLVPVALFLAWINEMLFHSSALLIFASAVAISTMIFGIAVGLSTAAVSAIAVDFFYLPPVLALNFDRTTLRISVEYALVSVIVHAVTRHVSARIRRQAKLGAFGQLDGVVDGEVYGWALDADNPNTPANVLIYVDERPVAETAAVYYRPDVANSIDCSGRHGFYVDVSEYCPPEAEVVVEARFSPARRLANSPVRARIPARASQAHSAAVLFMHIPRTAGTAFREAVTANYKQAEIAYIYPDPPGFLVGDLQFLPPQQRRSIRLVVGHFRYGMHASLPQDSAYVSVVRHPISRVVSQYLYLVHTGSELVKEKERQLSLEEMLERRISVDLDNALVRYFGGIDDTLMPPGTIDREAYERAVHHLRTRFAFVGHQETAQDSYKAMCQHFGWTARLTLENVNLVTNAVKHMDDRLSKIIEHYNAWDCLFYQELLSVFPISGG